MNPYNFSTLLFAFNAFLISLFVWFKRADEIGKNYFIFKLFVCLWAVGFSFMISDNISNSNALIASRVTNISALFIPLTWFYFVISYIQKKEKFRKLFYFIASVTLVVFIFANTKYFVPTTEPILSFAHFCKIGPLYHIFTAIFCIVIPFSFFLLVKDYLNSGQRFQKLGLIISTIAGFLGGGLTFLPAYQFEIPQYNIFLVPLYPFAMAYFMTRKGLFDEGEMAYAAHRNKLASIGILATSINHEVRNPLYVIQGLAESHLANIKEGYYPNLEKACEKSNDIHQKTADLSHRAMSIMKRFAMFAKSKSSINDSFEELNVRKLLENVLYLIEHDFKVGNIVLQKNISDSFLAIHANAQDTEEILFNLLVNSRQALEGCQNPCIQINLYEKNENVIFEIQDNGAGIEKQTLRKIFEPFYTTKAEGTGLGLYITKQLVERNNGKIKVESKVGEGTTFTLEFKQSIDSRLRRNDNEVNSFSGLVGESKKVCTKTEQEKFQELRNL